MIGFCSSPRFVEHDTGPHHPERPDRIRAILRAVRQAGLIDSPDPFPAFRADFGLRRLAGPKLMELDFTPAEQKWIETVHPARHIEHVRHICQHSGVLDQGDTQVCPASFDIALLAAGAAIRAAEAVASGQVSRAFAAVRPPGHHAEPQRAMGFCLFNNIAIAARFLQQKFGLQRLAIVDFDVHHGNGTQATFENDPDVLFVSLHQHPRTLYPGSGHDWEIGVGPGRGSTLNLVFDPSGLGDEEYLAAIAERVVPAVEAFGPRMMLVSAGFDGHRDDPLAQIQLTEDGFEAITRRLVDLAERCCGGKLASVLEGGYHLPALARGVVRHLIGLE